MRLTIVIERIYGTSTILETQFVQKISSQCHVQDMSTMVGYVHVQNAMFICSDILFSDKHLLIILDWQHH